MRQAAALAACWLAVAGCRKRDRDAVLGPMPGDAAPVVVILPPDAGAPIRTVPEREPNDSPGQAVSLLEQRPIRGTIAKPMGRQKDRDYFRLTIPDSSGPQVLRVRVVPPSTLAMSVEVRLHPSYERIAHRRAGRPGREVIIPDLTLNPGTYYIGVQAKGRTWDEKHPYLLFWRLTPWRDTMEREPNDKAQQANTIQPGRDVSGLFGRQGDVDWYKVTLDGPTVLNLQFRGVPEVRAGLDLFDEARRLILSRKARTGRGITIHDLEGRGRFLFIRLTARKGANPKAAYLLRLDRAGRSPSQEREPNDTVSSAQTLEGAKGSLEGRLDGRQDKDLFRVKVSAPKNLRLVVSPAQGLDVQVRLLDASGKTLQRANAGGPGTPEILPDILVSGKDRYVEVSTGRRERRGGSYHLSWALTAVERGDENEPNNTRARATRLVAGVSARGYIYPPGDRDYYWFQFPGTPGHTVRVRLRVQGIPRVRLRLRLWDSSGNLLAESTKQSPAGTRSVELNLHVGLRYYVSVDDDSGRRANAQDAYELELIKVW